MGSLWFALFHNGFDKVAPGHGLTRATGARARGQLGAASRRGEGELAHASAGKRVSQTHAASVIGAEIPWPAARSHHSRNLENLKTFAKSPSGILSYYPFILLS